MVLIGLHDKSVPKKSKIKVRAPTQDELIARALDMEEGNIVEHKIFLSVEEEKKKRAHAVRATISGSLLRCILGLPILTLEGGGDGGNSSTSPAPGISNTTLVVRQPGDNVDASQLITT
jgi:vacuolar protein sorting-associated protein 72